MSSVEEKDQFAFEQKQQTSKAAEASEKIRIQKAIEEEELRKRRQASGSSGASSFSEVERAVKEVLKTYYAKEISEIAQAEKLSEETVTDTIFTEVQERSKALEPEVKKQREEKPESVITSEAATYSPTPENKARADFEWYKSIYSNLMRPVMQIGGCKVDDHMLLLLSFMLSQPSVAKMLMVTDLMLNKNRPMPTLSAQ